MASLGAATLPWRFGDRRKAREVFLQLLLRVCPEQASDQRAEATGGRIITEYDSQKSRAARRLMKINFAYGLDIAAHAAPCDSLIGLERYGLSFPFDA
jgi:hypothetical protein